jgi:hypothetical protein
MPRQSENEQKPIYIPRNVYVPVIRPVFVPRERIIIKPQIIHVARPVLVDRPVPVQQKPIVIERDRPIPVRVETVEKIENIESTIQNQGSNVVYREEVVDVPDYSYTYEQVHEQKSDDKEQSYQGYQYETKEYPELNLSKYFDEKFIQPGSSQQQQQQQTQSVSRSDGNSILQDLIALNAIEREENERKKNELQSSAAGPAYTLELFDSTVSDKFQKVDYKTLKSEYGFDQSTFGSSAQQNNGYNSSEYGYSSVPVAAAAARNDSFKSISQELQDLNNSRTFKASGNVLSNNENIYGGGAYTVVEPSRYEYN